MYDSFEMQEFYRHRSSLRAKQEHASLLEDFREFDRTRLDLEDGDGFTEQALLKEHVGINRNTVQVNKLLRQCSLLDSTAVSYIKPGFLKLIALLYKRCRWMVSFHKLRQHLVHLCFNVQLLEASTQSLAMSPAVYPRYKDLSFLLFTNFFGLCFLYVRVWPVLSVSSVYLTLQFYG